MFQRIIVPIDGSQQSWTAAEVGSVIAEACDADLELTTVVFAADQVDVAVADMRSSLESPSNFAVEPSLSALVAEPASDDTVGAVLARHAEAVNGSMIVMSSTGRDRSAAVLGSVADDVLRGLFGPIIVVGPHVTEFESFAGDIIVPVDGSDFSEASLPLAASWGIAFGATPWIVEVLTEPVPAGVDVFESSYPSRLAKDLKAQSHHDVEFDVLHGPSPAKAITDYAGHNKASLIVMSTHGRTGMQRLSMGSTAAAVVRSASSPVVLHRPPHFASG
jgi:nucleotide-binding universal stress UspA family protein